MIAPSCVRDVLGAPRNRTGDERERRRYRESSSEWGLQRSSPRWLPKLIRNGYRPTSIAEPLVRATRPESHQMQHASKAPTQPSSE